MAADTADTRSIAALVGAWRVPLAYGAVVLGTYLVALAIGTVRSGHPTVAGDVVTPFLFPVLFFLLPPIVGAWQTAIGGRPRQALAVGAMPAIAFVVMVAVDRLLGVQSGAEAPLATLVVLYGVLGTLGSGLGMFAVLAFRRVVGDEGL